MTTPATSFDLERPPEPTITDPTTGEIIHRTETEKVGALLETVRQYKREADKAIKWCTGAILERMDSEARWTLPMGAFKLVGDTPTATSIDWDVDELQKLKPLLGEERYRELVHEVVEYKPQTTKLQNAAKAGGEIQGIIERAERRSPKPYRYVKVSRA